MSSTEIYAVCEGKEPIFLGECKNAFRGAMYVWNDMAARYFNLPSFPYSDEEMQRKVWNAGNHRTLSASETITLASTMDKATVEKDGIPSLLSAFDEYAASHENSSIGEQASIIREAKNEIPDGYKLAWIQTTVCDGWFREYNEESEECECNLTDAFDVVSQSTHGSAS